MWEWTLACENSYQVLKDKIKQGARIPGFFFFRKTALIVPYDLLNKFTETAHLANACWYRKNLLLLSPPCVSCRYEECCRKLL